MKGLDESTTQAKVSFGSVATYVFDTTSNDSTSPKRLSKRSSVEDFERLRRPPRQHRKGRKVAATTSQPDLNARERSRKLLEVRQQIEATIDAADIAIRGESSSFSFQPTSRSPPHDGQFFNASFPGPSKPLLRRPRTRSMNRISQLHLSQLDLSTANSRKQSATSSASQFNSESTQNAVFNFGRVSPNTAPDTDTTPKRPTRKRSSDRLVEARIAKSLIAPSDISFKNANWNMLTQTSNKRSRDCLDVKSFKQQDSSAAPAISLQNATWRMLARPTKRRSKESMLGSSFLNQGLCSTLDASTRNATWQLPTCPVRKQSKESLLEECLANPTLHSILAEAEGHMANATW